MGLAGGSIVIALAVGAIPALAAQRFAAPTPAGTANCSPFENACSIEMAVGGASSGDEAIVEPGSYR